MNSAYIFPKIFIKYFKHYQGLPLLAWKGIIIELVQSSLMGISYFLTFYFTKELHFNISAAGILMSFYGGGAILGSLIAGKLSDFISPRWVTSLSLLMQGIGFLCLIKLRLFYLLAINLFVLGMASYGFLTANQVYVLSYCYQCEKQRLKAINILNTFSNLGLGIASISIGFIAVISFKIIFLVTSLVFFFLAIYIIFSEKTSNSNSRLTPIKKDFLQENSNHFLGIMIFVLFCLVIAGCLVAQMNSTYPVYLEKTFPVFGIKSFSLLLAINTLMVVFFQTPIGNSLGDRHKILKMGIGLFVLSLGFLMLNFAYYFWITVFSCIVLTLGEIIFFSLSFLICYENSPENQKGNATGLYRMVYASSRFLGPFIGGLLYYHCGAKILWNVCGLMGFICLLISVVTHRYGL